MRNFQEELLALQGYEGISKRQLIGHNGAVSTSSETVWGAGGTFARLAANAAFEVVSDSASDTSAGVGARTVEALMITLAGVETPLTLTLNGTTPVAITGTYVGCNGLRVLTTGSTPHNVGNVDVRLVSGSVVHRRIQAGTVAAPVAGLGRDADFVFMIPAGYDGLLQPVRVMGAANTGSLISHLLQYDASGVLSVIGCTSVSLQGIGVQKADPPPMNFGHGIKIPALHTIELRIIMSAGAGETHAMADLYLYSRTNSPIYHRLQNGRII